MARASEEERQLWRLRVREMEESGMYRRTLYLVSDTKYKSK
jgi:hypothetical protein